MTYVLIYQTQGETKTASLTKDQWWRLIAKFDTVNMKSHRLGFNTIIFRSKTKTVHGIYKEI